MDSECFRIEELEALSSLGTEDPRLDHLRDCPQCRSLLASYRAFVEPTDLPRGADLEDARNRLSAFVNREVVRTDGVTIDPAGGFRKDEGERFRSVLDGFFRRPLRPALAMAAAVLVIFGANRILDTDRPRDHEIVLRGGETTREATVTLAAPERLEDGRVRLSWSALADADGYRVLFFGVDLAECARIEAGRENELLIDPSRVDCLAQGRGPVFYRVVVLRRGEPAVQSSPKSFPTGGDRTP